MERQFVTIARALDRDRFSVSLGCIKRTGPFVEEVEEVIEFSPGGNLFGMRSWRARLRLAQFLKEKQVQIVQLQPDVDSSGPVGRCSRCTGKPSSDWDLLTTAKFRAQRHAFRFCDRVVCNSRGSSGFFTGGGCSGI